MRRTIGLVLVISFIAVGVFGLAAMGLVGEHAHNGCIAATASRIPCPASENSDGAIAFHLEAFKNFSRAPSGSMLIVLMLAILLSSWGAALAPPRSKLARVWLPFERVFFLLHSLRDHYRRLHFLALLEHSPALA